MVTLKLLGRAELRGNDGELDHSFLAGPKRLGLLGYLVLNRKGGFKRRDKILPFLWPDKGQKSARNALSNMLYHIRKTLGSDFVLTRGTEELAINPDILECDALDFREAVLNKEWREVAELYKGKILDGLHIPNASPEFEQWLDRERDIYQKDYMNALWELANAAEESQQFDSAINWLEILNQEDPYNSEAVKNLLRLLHTTGKRSQVKRVAENHARLMGEEFGEVFEDLLEELNKSVKKSSGQSLPDPKLDPGKNTDSRSIAVLPFEEIGSSTEVSDFANGLHHDLLTRLAGVGDLKVISRTSVLRYRNTKLSIRQIANELGVNFIVEGAVQQSASQLRLHVQLIDTKSDQHHTAITYDRKLSEETIFDIQSDLAISITNRLKAELTPNEEKQVINQPTQNVEAYFLYNQGRSYLNKRTERSLNAALQSFQNSLKHDNKYAQAWAGLAETLILAKWYNYQVPQLEVDAMEASVKALSLNPELAEAHLTMGILYTRRLNGSDAKRELEKAVSLQPSFAEAYSWLGWLLAITGQLGEAIPASEKSVKLDPYSTYTRAYLSVIYLSAGRFQEALKEARAAISIEPEYGIGYYLEGLILYHLQKIDEAEFALTESLKLLNPKGALSEQDIEMIMALNAIQKNEAEKLESIQKKLIKYNKHALLGVLYASMGKTDDAFAQFEMVPVWKAFTAAMIRYFYPNELKDVRADARYKSILEKVNRSWNLE
ncbi:tetratricopeptide repeat protein [Rhodohalobacter sp.]|uniref:tetratricopeptide repeat protein n=1 Tax=Rhodohalobacter sp. TaxID=1974210 RepID=UPI0035666C94